MLMAFFGLCACIQGAFAKEKLTLNAPYDEMPSEIQNSDTFVEQLYVQEKKKFRPKNFAKEKLKPQSSALSIQKTRPERR